MLKEMNLLDVNIKKCQNLDHSISPSSSSNSPSSSAVASWYC